MRMHEKLYRDRSPPPLFQLVAAMNPCPCGYYGSVRCDCSPDRVARYQRRVSGPLLDRIDMQIQVELPERAVLLHRGDRGESSANINMRVIAAQKAQLCRQGKMNARLSINELEKYAPIHGASEPLINLAMDKLGLSARGLHKVLRVARTLADLESSVFSTAHIKQALGYRDPSFLN